MKINWGVGISLSIILFTIISLAFVYFAFNQDVNLVRDDYYEAEISFDEKMETIKRTKELDENLNVKLVDGKVDIIFPRIFSYSKISGNILLYRPSSRKFDFSEKINIDSTYSHIVESANLSSGMWKVQIDWMVDSTKYFNEEIIMVQ